MKLLADEGVDGPIVARLRVDGHDVEYIAEFDPGILDTTVLDHSRRASSLLLTADKDFGDLVFRQGRANHGVRLIRLLGLSPESKARLVSSAIDRHGPELKGAFAVLTPNNLRIRHRISR